MGFKAEVSLPVKALQEFFRNRQAKRPGEPGR
jgi:hypothetical protein